MKINQFFIENCKRVKAVAVEPAEAGVTVLGGRNGQGKTSVLDAIAWALAGDRYKPDNPKRGGTEKPHIKVTLSNGFIVERKGDSPLSVTDPTGRKKGVTLLKEFISEIAVDLPKFLEANDKGKTEYLLKVIGVGDALAKIDSEIKSAMDSRRTQGQIRDREKASYEKMPYYPDMEGKEQADVAVLMAKQKAINEGNLKKQAKKGDIAVLRGKAEAAKAYAGSLRTQLEAAEAAEKEAEEALKSFEAEAGDLTEESTAEIEGLLMTAEGWNAKIRQNAEKLAARQSAEAEAEKYAQWTAYIEGKRNERLSLLSNAKLPLAGLSVDDEMRLTYNGQTWDGMSGSEQLRVAAAIARALNPNCGFVLMDKLEQMDSETLAEFDAWCRSEGVQVIATRVTSDADDCTILIEDGMGGNIEPEKTDPPKMPPNVAVVPLPPQPDVPETYGTWEESPFA